jgi:hypothetical protein
MQTAVSQPQYEITEQDKAQKRQIAAAWAAHDGQFADQLQLTPEGANPNANSNRMEPIVFAGVNFLFGKPLQIMIDQGSPPAAQNFLDDAWGITETRMPLLQDLATSGAVAGQAFLRIVPNKDLSQFRLVVVDPLTVYVQTAPQDCKTVLLYCIEYSVQQQVSGSANPQQVYYREEIRRLDPDGNSLNGMQDADDAWTINHWTRIGDKGAWQETEGGEITWPYNFSPIFTCQNRSSPHDFWGKSDITPDLIQQNEDINLVQSNAQMIQILYAAPFLFAPGMGEGIIDRVPGHIIQLPLPENRIESVNIQTDVANTLSYLNRLDDNLSEQSAIPGALARQSEAPRVNSGIQMELMFQGILAKTDMKRCRYGELIIDVSKALLVLGNFSPDIDVSLKWKSALPVDPLEMAQAIQALVGAGLSQETALGVFGIDAAAEEEKKNAEQARQVVAASRGQGFPPSPPQQPAQAPPDQQQEQGGQNATGA